MDKYNFRETDDLKHDCTSCIHFISYAERYYDDQEPDYLGVCKKDVSDFVGYEMTCDLRETLITE